MPALIEHLCLQRCSQFGCGRAGGERSEWGPAGVGSSCQPAAAEMAGAVEDIHSGFSLSSTGKWMPRMAAPLEAPNGCYSARTPAKLAMAGRMAGLLEPAWPSAEDVNTDRQAGARPGRAACPGHATCAVALCKAWRAAITSAWEASLTLFSLPQPEQIICPSLPLITYPQPPVRYSCAKAPSQFILMKSEGGLLHFCFLGFGVHSSA